jgi:hypothetical protein
VPFHAASSALDFSDAIDMISDDGEVAVTLVFLMMATKLMMKYATEGGAHVPLMGGQNLKKSLNTGHSFASETLQTVNKMLCVSSLTKGKEFHVEIENGKCCS